MIEILDAERCTACDICVRICPTNVFDVVEGSVPVIARQSDCQTCFQCEAYCPADAIFVAPARTPAPNRPELRDTVTRLDLLGMYRDRVGWRKRGGADTRPDTADRPAPATPPGTADYHPFTQTLRSTP